MYIMGSHNGCLKSYNICVEYCVAAEFYNWLLQFTMLRVKSQWFDQNNCLLRSRDWVIITFILLLRTV